MKLKMLWEQLCSVLVCSSSPGEGALKQIFLLRDLYLLQAEVCVCVCVCVCDATVFLDLH